jgi:hypothetical protein
MNLKLAPLLLVSSVLWVAPPTLGTTKAKLVPDNFHGIDFNNYTFPYRFSWGRNVRVVLKNGKYEYDLKMERGWFSLAHVYVADVTGDNRPEAIVMLWHVACGVSCDGGSALFYIYSFQNRTLKRLWRYETGSLAYGCGLKSFAANGTALTVELFGRCTQRNRTPSVTGKFHVKDATRVTFQSDRGRFVVRKRKFLSLPEQSVLNYEPQITVAQ